MIGLPKRHKATHSHRAVAAAHKAAAAKKAVPKDTGRLRGELSTTGKVLLFGVAILGTVATEEVVRNIDTSPAHEAAQHNTPADKRAAVARSIVLPFGQCRIIGVTDEHHSGPKAKGKGTTTVSIKVMTTPGSTNAKAIADKSTTSTAPVGVGVILDPKKPHETAPLSLVADDNEAGSSDVNNGSGEFKLYPTVNAPAGTRIGVYVLKTVQMNADGQHEQYAGVTPCGELELVKPDGGAPTWQDYRGDHPSMVPGFAEVPPDVTLQQAEQAMIPS